MSDHVFERIGTPSASMGRAFGCEEWAVELFSEEVIRGGPAFALSLVLGNVKGAFRAAANLGSWQDEVYKKPKVMVAKRVSGEEEISEGVVALLTSDAPDVLSHVSVRARNMSGVVGAKSRNIAGLRQKIPDWIQLPSSVTLPFGTFEHVLSQKENKEIKSELEMKLKHVEERPAVFLDQCRKLVMQVQLPDALQSDLRTAMEAAGIPPPHNEERWDLAKEAMKGVWASKFNDRAYFSMRKVGLKIEDLRMAVLVQRVVPAEYAFVIHTKNPSNGKEDEICCEMVKGLGESLVSGMVPGSSMAFVGDKANSDRPQVLLYPSKSAGMFVTESLIFRSDSNSEDLEGYAGALTV